MHRLYKTPKKKGNPFGLPFFFYFFQKNAFSTKGKLYFVRLIDVDKMLIAKMLSPCHLALVRFSFIHNETI